MSSFYYRFVPWKGVWSCSWLNGLWRKSQDIPKHCRRCGCEHGSVDQRAYVLRYREAWGDGDSGEVIRIMWTRHGYCIVCWHMLLPDGWRMDGDVAVTKSGIPSTYPPFIEP